MEELYKSQVNLVFETKKLPKVFETQSEAPKDKYTAQSFIKRLEAYFGTFQAQRTTLYNHAKKSTRHDKKSCLS